MEALEKRETEQMIQNGSFGKKGNRNKEYKMKALEKKETGTKDTKWKL